MSTLTLVLSFAQIRLKMMELHKIKVKVINIRIICKGPHGVCKKNKGTLRVMVMNDRFGSASTNASDQGIE